MKLKESKKSLVSSKKLNLRLFISIAIGLLMAVSAYVGFNLVKSGPTLEEAPALIRHSFVLNERFWSQFYSSNNLSVKKPNPPIGKKPRVNGLLGLEDDLVLKNYRVTIESGNTKLSLPISAFYTTPKFGYATDFRCVEGWSEIIQFAGAKFSDFMEFYHVGRKADGTYYNYVGFETPDRKYYVSIDIESMLHPQTLLAYEMNGKNLLEENGAPLRLAIPIKYGFKNLKRIGRIFFSDTRPPDYWAEDGYDWYAGL